MNKAQKFLIENRISDIIVNPDKCKDSVYRIYLSDLLERYLNEPKPIDFGVPGRVLKGENSIVKTTGYHSQVFFSGIYLDSDSVGFTSNGFIKSCNWLDITDTYKP